MTARLVALLCVCFLTQLASIADAREGPDLRRFVFTVAAHDGGAARDPLRYAVDDARAVVAVLRELGGVDPRDQRSLVSPTPRALREAFVALRDEIAASAQRGVRTEVVFYYSGHSDDTALLLGSARFAYTELRALLDALPADVRIAILDSCASGAFTRLKGGVQRPPFVIDAASKVRGHAFLTSSSADESAQESDRIGGSFFTHYLVSGLRGAADESGDRKVTLNEAYRFAFEETLARTAQTQFGSQHPGYEIRLVGTGDLVMTDLRVTDATLVLDAALDGRVFVWDAHGRLVIEVEKPRGRSSELAVPAGTYKLERTQAGHYYAGTITVRAGEPRRVGEDELTAVARESTLARGLRSPPMHVPAGAALVPALSTNRRGPPRRVENALDFALLYDDPDALAGFQLAVIGGGVREIARGVQLAGLFTYAGALVGLQLSGEFNGVAARAVGAQLTFGVNATLAGLTGLQLGAINLTGALTGVSLGGINVTRLGSGAQLGLLNAAGDFRGLQLGGINVAAGRVQGMQLGLLNYADEADVSLAPLGITRKGGVHAQVALTDVFAPELSLRVEANYNYSFVSLGLAPFGRHDAWAFGWGLGAKIPLYAPALWLDIDLTTYVMQRQWDYRRGMPNTLVQARLLPRLSLHRRLSVLMGLTVNVLVQTDETFRVTPGLDLRRRAVDVGDDARLLIWPGFLIGIRA